MKKNIHLLQSIDTKTGGGLISGCLQLSRAQSLLGNNVKVFSTSNETVEPKDLDYDVNIYARKFKEPFLYASELYDAIKKNINTDTVIHSHGLYIYTSFVASKLIKNYGVDSVIHVHGMFEPWVLKRSRIKKRIVGYLYEDYKIRTSKFWRALTSKEADQVKKQGVKGKVIVLPNGIDLKQIDDYKRQNFFLKDNSKSLLFLGRIHEKKGLIPFVKSWMSLSNSLKKNWTFDIVGPDDGILKELKSITANDKSVVYHGAKTGYEKFALLNKATVFVLPSFSEGFSMAVLEGMAFGKPVIITDECNFGEAYKYGALRLDSDTKLWNDNLKRILSITISEFESRGDELLQLVKEKYIWEKIAVDLNNAIS